MFVLFMLFLCHVYVLVCSILVSLFTLEKLQNILKLEHIVVYENSSDEFDIGHRMIKVKATV